MANETYIGELKMAERIALGSLCRFKDWGAPDTDSSGTVALVVGTWAWKPFSPGARTQTRQQSLGRDPITAEGESGYLLLLNDCEIICAAWGVVSTGQLMTLHTRTV